MPPIALRDWIEELLPFNSLYWLLTFVQTSRAQPITSSRRPRLSGRPRRRRCRTRFATRRASSGERCGGASCCGGWGDSFPLLRVRRERAISSLGRFAVHGVYHCEKKDGGSRIVFSRCDARAHTSAPCVLRRRHPSRTPLRLWWILRVGDTNHCIPGHQRLELLLLPALRPRRAPRDHEVAAVRR